MTEHSDAGLCAGCVHGRLVETARGSSFLFCRRSEIDPQYPRYPRLPMLRCRGYEAGSKPPAGFFWGRYWFLIALVIVVCAGISCPAGGQALRRAGFVLPLLTASTLFISGLSLETSRLRFSAAGLGALGVGLGSIYGVAPIAAWFLALGIGPTVGGPDSEGYLFLEAVMIAAAQAGTIASAPALTMIARGNQALALGLTVASNLLTVVATPLVLQLSLGAIVSFPFVEMVWRMTRVVLLPVIVGQVVRRVAWERLRGALPALRITSQAIILVFVYTGVSSAADHLTATPELILRFFAVAALLHLLLLGFALGSSSLIGLDPPSRTALVFCGTQKTLPNGIYVWDRFFAANPHGAIALVLYHVFQLVVDTLLVPWLARARSR